MSTINTSATKQFDNQPGVSAVDVVALPWVFTQHHPLDSSDFIRHAKDRGVDLDALTLRQLYKHRVLIPIVAVTARRYAEPRILEHHEPLRAGTRLYQLREARKDGRLVDLSTEPFPRDYALPRRSRTCMLGGMD